MDAGGDRFDALLFTVLQPTTLSFTLGLTPSTLNLKPSTLDLGPSTLNLKPLTLNSKPSILNFEHSATHSTPQTLDPAA